MFGCRKRSSDDDDDPGASSSKHRMSDDANVVDIDNSATVIKKIAKLYAERLMSDVTLVVGDVEFPSHRLILCASSDVFQVMLMNQSWTESQEKRVVLVEAPGLACFTIFFGARISIVNCICHVSNETFIVHFNLNLIQLNWELCVRKMHKFNFEFYKEKQLQNRKITFFRKHFFIMNFEWTSFSFFCSLHCCFWRLPSLPLHRKNSGFFISNI